MALINSYSSSPSIIGVYSGSSGSAASLTLTNAYVQNTSGDAVGIRFMARSTDTIDAIWVFVTAVSGSPVLAATIIGEQAAQNTRPATSGVLDTSTSADTPTANAWSKITFGTPYTPSVGEILWIVVHKTSGTTCDIRTAHSGIQLMANTYRDVAYTTANGYTSNGTIAGETPHLIKQGSNYFGQPFTARASSYYTSNQLERGIKIIPPVTCKMCGVEWDGPVAPCSDFVLRGSSGVPGGAAIATYDLDSDTGETTNDYSSAKIFDSEETLTAGSTYYLTFTFSTNSPLPSSLQIENYATYSTEFGAFRDANPLIPISVIDNGAGGWTEDKSVAPGIILLISDYPAASGGGAHFSGFIS